MCSSLWASKLDSLLAPAVERLDYRFFYWLFDEEGIGKAYVLAQEEDFESGPKVLFTDEMLSLFKIPQRNWEEKLGDLDELWYLEEELKTLDAKVSTELIQKWRYAYLQKMMQFIREKANRKPLFNYMFMSATSHDSNIVRADDVDLTSGQVTNEADGQQMVLFNVRWSPWINDASFSKLNKFSQALNVIHIHQFRHKSNQVMIFDTESKWTRKLEGALNDLSLSYRLQNFGLSGNASSRDTSAKFYTHRLKADLSLKPRALSGFLKSTKSDFSASYILKEQLSDADKVAGNDKDATDFRLSAQQSVDYDFSGTKGSASAKLEFVTYSNDDFVAGDYDYWTLTFDNNNKFKVTGLKEPLKVSEKISIRNKSWGDATAPIQDEVFMTFSLKASTKISKSWSSYLSFSQSARERDSNTNVETDADQTVISLGFIWSAP